MSDKISDVLVVRLADPSANAVRDVLTLCGVDSGPDPRWRRHAPNLLTVRVADEEIPGRLATHPAVDRVIALGGSRLVARWPNGEPPPVRLRNGAAFGGTEPVVIAGPCSVEGPQQVLDVAEAVAAAGARALRGGVFKPRTSPYDFGGLGADGLRMLVRASERTGLPFATEVLEPSCTELVARHADVLQIGSRNMHNTPFLFALGAHPGGRPALLKRGFGATIEEFLDAAEYFLLGRLAAGHEHPGLILCERGLRTFETATRFTLDVAAIQVLAARTHLPVIVDPSHPAGDSVLVPSLALAAIAAGAHGLLVEVHTDPKSAWCDGRQSLDVAAFRELMSRVNEVAPARTSTLPRASTGGQPIRSQSGSAPSTPTSLRSSPA